MRRHLALFDLAAANLVRRPAKSVAVLVPLVVALAVASAMTVVRDGLLRDAAASAEALPDVTVQKMVGGRIERISAAVADSVAALPGVRRALPRVWGYIPVTLEGGAEVAFTLMGLDLSAAPAPSGIGRAVERGRFLAPGARGEAIVGKAFARALGAAPGTALELRDAFGGAETFAIVGVFSTPVQILSADLVVVGIEDARAYFGFAPGEAADLLVEVEAPDAADAVAGRIAALDPSLRVMTRGALADAARRAYGGRGGVFTLFWLVLLLTALLVAFAQATSVQIDFVREVGILKAVGWDVGEVIELKMLESLLLGLTGSLGGILLGLGYAALDAPFIKPFFLGWATVYPEFPLPLAVEPAEIFLLLAVGVLPLLAATAVPAWIVGTLPPDEAIRR